jgi:hypothetical protein
MTKDEIIRMDEMTLKSRLNSLTAQFKMPIGVE